MKLGINVIKILLKIIQIFLLKLRIRLQTKPLNGTLYTIQEDTISIFKI